ncbi:hypothetical protein BOW28_11740 [Solemya velum gill symbiont]|nr:hypothetical protein BOW28_11740 [Solemya velum gill symbiont]
MQNLFYHGKENRTMSLNSHYLVLFKNPRDQQQIGFLARQMYPGKPKFLLDKYVTHTERPFGYLIVDLKPDTPETRRLLSNVFPEEKEKKTSGELTWKPPIENTAIEDYGTRDHYDTEPRVDPVMDRVCENEPVTFRPPHWNLTEGYKKQLDNQVLPELSRLPGCNAMPYGLPREDPRGYTCADCGEVVATVPDLQRHLKEWCPEDYRKPSWTSLYNSSSDEDDDEPSSKRKRSCELPSEDHYFKHVATKAKENNHDEWEEKIEKYKNAGLSDEDAKNKARRKIRTRDIAGFMNKYAKHIQYLLVLDHGGLHGKVMQSIHEYMDDGVGRIKAIRMSLRKFKHELREYLESDEEGDFDQTDASNDYESD